MTIATTAQTFQIVKALAALDFRPMTDNDFAAFAGAADDAMIAFDDGTLLPLITALAGHDLEPGGLAIIMSGDHIEFSAIGEDGEPIAIAFDLARLI